MSKAKERNEAIKNYCIWCCGDDKKEVALCTAKNCPLWRWRKGKEDKSTVGFQTKNNTINKKRLTRLQAVKERCLNCSAWIPDEVKNCKFKDCQLYNFRTG